MNLSFPGSGFACAIELTYHGAETVLTGGRALTSAGSDAGGGDRANSCRSSRDDDDDLSLDLDCGECTSMPGRARTATRPQLLTTGRCGARQGARAVSLCTVISGHPDSPGGAAAA
jgi:hypothetical protein